MSEDLNKLRELAEAATPGPWTNTPAHSIGFKSPMPDFHKAHIHVGPRENYGNALACAIMGGPGATGSSAAEVDANAAFIAAFNPATALSLLSRLQAAEERAEKVAELLALARPIVGEAFVCSRMIYAEDNRDELRSRQNRMADLCHHIDAALKTDGEGWKALGFDSAEHEAEELAKGRAALKTEGA